MFKEPIEPSSMSGVYPQTISDALDRLDIPASKIGLITADEALGLLNGLDTAYARTLELEPGSQSRNIAEAKLNEIVAKLRKEAGRFIRDSGGSQALQQARAEANPPPDHAWWYLDTWLEEKRQAAVKRSLITIGAVAIIFVLLAVLYNRFLAPDPQESARYGYQQSATAQMVNGEFEGALRDIDQGLKISPNDPELIVYKGVIQEQLGQPAQAAESFRDAEQGYAKREDFLLARAQAYLMAHQPEKVLADVQAVVELNPQAASAYLLRGQAHEAQQKYNDAMDDYNLAFKTADANGQTELAAMSRIYIAMLTQTMNAQIQAEPFFTPTPAP
jgi:tetratricopeptide (TPR) repeat protein